MQHLTRVALAAAAAPLALVLFTAEASAVETDVPLVPPGGMALVSSQPVAGTPVSPGCVDTIDASHVLTRTVAGSTLSGSLMRTMTVYSNGLVVRSAWDGATGRSHAEVIVVDRLAVQDLAGDLVALGATRVCDSPIHVSDVPATTVTFSDGGADAHSHSYTYQVATGERELIEDRIEQFMLTHVHVD